MASPEDVRCIALALPGAREAEHSRAPPFKARPGAIQPMGGGIRDDKAGCAGRTYVACADCGEDELAMLLKRAGSQVAPTRLTS